MKKLHMFLFAALVSALGNSQTIRCSDPYALFGDVYAPGHMSTEGLKSSAPGIISLNVKSIVGDADRLIKSLGENPVNYTQSRFFTWKDKYGPTLPELPVFMDRGGEREKSELDLTSVEKAEKQRVVAEREKILAEHAAQQLTNLPNFYLKENNNQVAYALKMLSLDIAALQERAVAIEKDPILKDKLLSFVRIGQSVLDSMNQDLVNKIIINFMTIKPVSLDDAIEDAQNSLNENKSTQDQFGIQAHEKILSMLRLLQQEIQKLLRSNNNSIDDAIEAAKKIKLNAERVKNVPQISFYSQVLAQLELDKKYTEELYDKIEQEDSELKSKVDAVINGYGDMHPLDIIQSLEEKNNNKKSEMLLYKDLRNPRNKIKTQEIQAEINLNNKAIESLKNRVRDLDLDMKKVMTVMDDLLRIYGSPVRALTEAKNQLTKLQSMSFKDTSKIATYEKVVAELQRKTEENTTFTAKVTEKINSFIGDPVASLAQAETELESVENDMYAHDREQSIAVYKKVIEQLQSKVKLVELELDTLMSRYSNNASTALTAVQGGSYLTAKYTIKDSETRKGVESLLRRKIKEGANDPTFFQKLFSGGVSGSNVVSQVSGATNNLASAALSPFGLTLDQLSESVRIEIATALDRSQKEIMALMARTDISPLQKAQQKNEMTKAMSKEVGVILGAHKIGVSQAALASGDATTIALDLALQKMIQGMTA